jgi:hypothetical protein
MSPAGLGPKNDCAGEASSNCKQQTRLIFKEDVNYCDRKLAIEKITSYESLEACGQDKLICGKPAVVKQL